jgi:hypothetical protein
MEPRDAPLPNITINTTTTTTATHIKMIYISRGEPNSSEYIPARLELVNYLYFLYHCAFSIAENGAGFALYVP